MEELEPWEALDLDDSDLSTFLLLRPCNRQTSQPLQTAMIHRRTLEPSNPIPTQEFVRRFLQNGHNSDRHFSAKPWLSAFHFLRSQVSTPLSSIKDHIHVGRVDLIVALIKSCTPNGFGDLTVTLKDTTGSVNASIHRKVFAEGEFANRITFDATGKSVLSSTRKNKRNPF